MTGLSWKCWNEVVVMKFIQIRVWSIAEASLENVSMSIDTLMIQAFVARRISKDQCGFHEKTLFRSTKRHLNPHKDPITAPFNLCILGVCFLHVGCYSKSTLPEAPRKPTFAPEEIHSSPALLVDFLFGHVSDALKGGMWIAPKWLLGLHHHFVFIDDMKFNKHLKKYVWNAGSTSTIFSDRGPKLLAKL